jgi:hypothetical protein
MVARWGKWSGPATSEGGRRGKSMLLSMGEVLSTRREGGCLQKLGCTIWGREIQQRDLTVSR